MHTSTAKFDYNLTHTFEFSHLRKSAQKGNSIFTHYASLDRMSFSILQTLSFGALGESKQTRDKYPGQK